MDLATADDVIEALRRRFAAPEWALFTGVSNGTGARSRRWADVLGMSIWPSRGLEIVGFEIKISRSDLLRELKNPQKADEIARYCDKWWIAVGSAKIVKPEELPPAWGLLVPMKSRSGITMQIVKDAKKTRVKAIDRTFLAAILRRASEHFDEDRIRRQLQGTLYKEIWARVEAQMQQQLEDERQRASDLQAALHKVQAQLCLASERQMSPQIIGRAIELLHRLHGWRGSMRTLQGVMDDIEADRKRLAEVVDTLRHARDVCELLDEKEQAS